MLELYYGVYTGKRFTIEQTKRVGQIYFAIGLVLGAVGITIAITTINRWESLIPILLSYFHIIIGALYLAKA
jgi:hypothetical protein